MVRDVTDINHPYTVSLLGNQVDYATQFVNGAELSAVVDGTGLVRMPLSGSPKTVVAPCGTRLFAWSPDGTAAAYVQSGQDDPQLEGLHVVSGGRDSVVNTIRNPIQGGVGCENRSSCSSFAFQVLYSPDGAYISLGQTPGTGLHVWTSSGKLATITTTAGATKPVWSGQTLYWRDNEGVELWRNGVESLVLPGVSWNSVHASPAGGLIVYETRDASGTGHIQVLDTATGTAREVAQSRGDPAFLSSRYIWYAGERPCASVSEMCLDPTTASGITYIYDLQTGTEAQSIITRVYDVWPHPA